MQTFSVTIGTKIPFFRVPITFEPGCSLLQPVTTNCLAGKIFFNGKRLSGCGKFANMFTQKRFTTAVAAQKHYDIFKKHMRKNRLNKSLEAKKKYSNLMRINCRPRSAY